MSEALTYIQTAFVFGHYGLLGYVTLWNLVDHWFQNWKLRPFLRGSETMTMIHSVYMVTR
jgi:hypothetical protein